jgi:hypothetical protein
VAVFTITFISHQEPTMFLSNLAVGFGLGLAAALWGWMADLSAFAVLGLYVLGGNLGVMTSALMHAAWAGWTNHTPRVSQQT